ncbi:hypothetical protein MMC11_006988 [Xylographa trunciseda]|nr:hypothetical protein [Xylographa trunciseda]
MQFKSLALLAVTFMAPSAYGCLRYSSTEFCDQLYLENAAIVDNGHEVCWFTGQLAGDGLYHYTCFQGNYAALQGNCDGVVEYANPSGNFRFQATARADGPDEVFDWSASEYGC